MRKLRHYPIIKVMKYRFVVQRLRGSKLHPIGIYLIQGVL